MAGRKGTAKGTKGAGYAPSRNQRTTTKERARRQAFRGLMDHASAAGLQIRLGVSTSDALQECLDRTVAIFRYAASKVDELSEDELFVLQMGPNGASSEVPHKWVQWEQSARHEIEKLAAVMTGLGIAERRVHIEEAQAALFVAAIRDAALSVGIPHDQVRALGAALRDHVANAVTEVTPTKTAAAASQSSATSAQVGSLGPGHGPS